MFTLAEIKEAIPRLSRAELDDLEQLVRQEKKHRTAPGAHSVLDISPITPGAMCPPLGSPDEYEHEPTLREFESWITQSVGLAPAGLRTSQILNETRGED